MTICDKIRTVGDTLETNLNARGVSCTFGTGTGEKTILDMVNLITSSNLKGSSDAVISISASRPYLLSGEKTDLIVRLADGLGQPLPNKSVSISDGTSVYSGLTNIFGEFTLYNITVSATTIFTATYGTIEDSVTVYYCTKVDYATSNLHTDIWTPSYFTLTRNDSYTSLVETSNTGACVMNSAYISNTSTLEFDMRQVDGSKGYAPFYIRNNNSSSSLAYLSYNQLGAELNEWVHIKIVFNDTTSITVYADTLEEPLSVSLSSKDNNGYRLMFNAGGAMTKIDFKNVIIY